MRGWIIGIIAVIVFLFIFIIALGYFGVISVPLVSPSVESYSSATEISYADVSRFIPQSGSFPTLDEMQSYGLTIHVYGTNDKGSVVRGFYGSMVSGWNQMVCDSGPGWSYGIWANNLYGFGLAVYDSNQVKQRTGYNTVFITVDGPATAWAPVFMRFS